MSKFKEPTPNEKTTRPLEPKFVFGLTPGASKNCFFLDDKKILYQASGVIVIHDISNNSQEILHLNEPQKTITTMELNKNKNLLAVVEMGKRPTISIYNLIRFKHIRRLVAPLEMKANSFIKIQFTWDNLYLAVLTDKPDYVMYYYNWKLSKVESHVHVVHPPTTVGPVYDMALNPKISGMCCFVGRELFRLMKLGELVWKQFGFYKANKVEFNSLCWLNENSIIAGTTDGRLFLVENGELKAVYNVYTLLDFDLCKAMKNPLETRPLSGIPKMKIRLCLPIKSGLMLVINSYCVYYYKITKDWRYTKYSEFLIHRDKRLESIEEDPELHTINTLVVNPENNIIVCVTKRNQIFWSKFLWKSGHEKVPIEPFNKTLHHGGVCGMSVSSWKPMFMTCGKSDRSVKLWNYENHSLLLSADYSEDVVDVSLHPTGLYAIVATASRVIFIVIYADALKPERSFDVAGCRLVKFSNAGHVFAVVVDEINVHVYSSITFQKLYELVGNNSAITTLSWAANDLKLYSCDEGGHVCQFDVHTGKHDFEITNLNVSDVAVSNDLKQLYMALKDGTVKEMNDQTIMRNINLDHGPLNAIILSRSNSMLFVACQSGVILSLKFPIEVDTKYKELFVHSCTISKMRLTIDDATLISCSVDGIICIWDVKDLKEKLTIHFQKNFADNMLVPMKSLKNNTDSTVRLNLKLNKLRNQFADDRLKLIGAHERHLQQLALQHSMNVKGLEKKIKVR